MRRFTQKKQKMFRKPNPDRVLKTITSLLVLLWTYTALSKLSEPADFRTQLDNQVFDRDWTPLLMWILPGAELLASAMLLFRGTRTFGLWLSVILMSVFTIYIALVLFGVFSRTPCSCGGVLKMLGWKSHFAFNLFFLTAAIWGTRLYRTERRVAVTS